MRRFFVSMNAEQGQIVSPGGNRPKERVWERGGRKDTDAGAKGRERHPGSVVTENVEYKRSKSNQNLKDPEPHNSSRHEKKRKKSRCLGSNPSAKPKVPLGAVTLGKGEGPVLGA